jgi:Protein of unknown function (DUF4232)
VARRRAGAGLALAAIALSAAGCGIGGSTKTVTVIHIRTHTVTVTTTVTATTTSASISACTGDQLSGTFKESSGGGGAGQIEYVLTLTNSSQTSCTLSGRRPVAVLLDGNGSVLPTHITGNTAPSILVTLAPGESMKATARFSPDVPGVGDSQSGACQPKAYTLRVTPNGGGTVDAPIKPPTSVCERGTLNFSG